MAFEFANQSTFSSYSSTFYSLLLYSLLLYSLLLYSLLLYSLLLYSLLLYSLRSTLYALSLLLYSLLPGKPNDFPIRETCRRRKLITSQNSLTPALKHVTSPNEL